MVRPDDLIVDKTRFSGFIPGTCGLHDLLQERASIRSSSPGR